MTDRAIGLRRALLLSVSSIVLGAVLGGIAVVVGLTTESLSLLGFGIDAAIDAAASVALVWRFHTETKQPHRADQIEEVAESIVGAVMLVLAVYLGFNAADALLSGAHPEPSTTRTVLLVAALLVLPPLAVAKYRVARSIGSRALRADSVLTGVAGGLAAIGLASLALDTLAHIDRADALGAIIIAIVIAREGWAALQPGLILGSR